MVCPSEVTEQNKSWFISVKDHNIIISEKKGICMVSEGKFKMGNGKTGIVRSNTSVLDFTKKTYTSEYFWMNEKNKSLNVSFREVKKINGGNKIINK